MSKYFFAQSRFIKWKSFLTVFVLSQLFFLFIFQPIDAVSLTVEISADPSSGKTPLNNVDLKATISGTATGNITYKFDCRSDGDWEKIITTNSTSYTAFNLCDYSSSGNYTAKISVERDGLTFEGGTQILVTETSAQPSFNVLKQARNISKNQISFSDFVEAEPLEKIEFQIRISSQGGSAISDIVVKDTLPQNLIYQGNLKIGGNPVSGNILPGISIGNLLSNQVKTVTFEVQVTSSENFAVGKTELINTTLAFNQQLAVSDALTVTVLKQGVAGTATAVSTGIFDLFSFSLILTLFFGFIVSYILLLRFYFQKQIRPLLFQKKAERNLVRVITRIKKKEREIRK